MNQTLKLASVIEIPNQWEMNNDTNALTAGNDVALSYGISSYF